MTSYKRSRATYEADSRASEAPFVSYGTPLPPSDEHQRDDGTYVPLHLQEVRDEKGRRRLHGAFTGGWSAGYFNTVGSKEGWTPSTFVSSRTARRKDDTTTVQQRPEDFMDEEDLADAAEAETIQATDVFAGIGARVADETQRRGLAGLVRPSDDTMGFALLRKMGWKDGQGIGPRVRRAARLHDGAAPANAAASGTYLFAPDDASPFIIERKSGRAGLGYRGEARLEQENNAPSTILSTTGKKVRKKIQRGGIGVGILNDNGSDEEGPYAMGPRISYNRTLGGTKKKKATTKTMTANPALGSKPTFVAKRPAARPTNSRRCGDGRPPLPGFTLASSSVDTRVVDSGTKYPPPSIPLGWKPKKQLAMHSTTAIINNINKTTSEAAKAPKHDPRTRAAALGESQLPGKSVFDFMSAAARDRIAAVTGKANLPPAKGEVPTAGDTTSQQKAPDVLERLPKLAKETAVAALSRGHGGKGPYADDEAKQSRFRRYLEYSAGFLQEMSLRPHGMTEADFTRELEEFYSCAQLFKPMAGFMATRFTTASATTSNAGGTDSTGATVSTNTRAPSQPGDPAEEAAKLGMFGNMTRSVQDFYPTRLLCKRFNVRPPEHVQQEPTTDTPPDNTSGNNDQEAVSKGPLGVGVHEQSTSGEETRDTAGVQMPHQQRPFRMSLAGSYRALSLNGRKFPAPTICPGETSLEEEREIGLHEEEPVDRVQSPPPQYPASEASSSIPPPFSSLYGPFEDGCCPGSSSGQERSPPGKSTTSVSAGPLPAAPAYAPAAPGPSDFQAVAQTSFEDTVAETKRALPRDTKGESSSKDDEVEPPPAYSEGPSPLLSFSFVMASAGGASSLITQVQQGGPPINALGDVGADESIAMDLRGTRFVLSRDELLTLPEFVLLSLFPNGLFPEGHMGSGFGDGDAIQVDYDPASLQYMLGFFRDVAQTIPAESSGSTSQDGDVFPVEPLGGRDDSSRRAGIIVLREDLDFYVIPPRPDVEQAEMMDIKRAAGRALLNQAGIFSGLKRSDEPGTTEAHLIEMLTAGGFNHDDTWGHRAGEPNKAVICSLALARLRSDIRGSEMSSNALGMAQKLLLFWRKPARRCWWEGVELDNVEGVPGKLKVWIRRVWTLEMSVIGLR
ncbi:hypothetical protein SODALDRAFT_337617 [Sodiomyces alkalinus F11]|uniref:G-patch domain-containing protein n=1 Tax=Sodiomyces alkalinus (strain CBS 110278 / VKM F-3762 / F11) TaxID=1314773 RepID=A0A3N2PK71_SODAK|nr:hypothetical protein SODALDRAFT_337617 [Sodiomyces alkalinus F11]ROT34927.1 hypothetical protein SODALDRAFT_337617 [Sodiomyces alkalinus F11]